MNLYGQPVNKCPNHQPVADLIPGPLVEIHCPNCGFLAVMGVEGYIDAVRGVEKNNAQPE